MGTADFEDQYQEWRNTTLQQGWKAADIVIGGLIDGAPYGESHTLAASAGAQRLTRNGDEGSKDICEGP